MGRSYIVIDGQGNGIIQNRRNGTLGQTTCLDGNCTISQASTGIAVGSNGASNIEVKNITVRNIYMVMDSTGGLAPLQSYDIVVYGSANNVSIRDSTFSDSNIGVFLEMDYGSFNQIDVYRNSIFHHSWGVGLTNGTNPSYSATNVFIHDNEIYNFTDWNLRFDTFHPNGVNAFTVGGGTGVFSPMTYNNYFHGILSGNSNSAGTGFVWCNYASGPNTPNHLCYVFNNVFDASETTWSSWNVADTLNGSQFYNNTIIGRGILSSGYWDLAVMPNGINTTLKNNIISNWYEWYYDIYTPLAQSITASDYNLFYNCIRPSGACFNGTTQKYTFAQWQTAGYDINSRVANPLLNFNYTLQTTSPARGLGQNLSNICQGQPISGLGALCYDKAGVARPSSGAWDIGAYQYTGSTPPTYKTGDFNHDGLVNSIDLSLMITAWNQNNATYDLNHDGIVNSLDYVVMVVNWSI